MKNKYPNDAGYVSGKSLESEITPEKLYFSRRKFMKMALTGAGTLALAACGINAGDSINPGVTTGVDDGVKDELGNAATSWETITNYNNFLQLSNIWYQLNSQN